MSNNELCKEHGRFPCRICGTKHFDGCDCFFCTDHPEKYEKKKYEKEKPTTPGEAYMKAYRSGWNDCVDEMDRTLAKIRRP